MTPLVCSAVHMLAGSLTLCWRCERRKQTPVRTNRPVLDRCISVHYEMIDRGQTCGTSPARSHQNQTSSVIRCYHRLPGNVCITTYLILAVSPSQAQDSEVIGFFLQIVSSMNSNTIGLCCDLTSCEGFVVLLPDLSLTFLKARLTPQRIDE